MSNTKHSTIMFIINITVICTMLILVACSISDSETIDLAEDNNSKIDESDLECGDCPQYNPPAPGWCDDGTIEASEVDDCGCRGHPNCIR